MEIKEFDKSCDYILNSICCIEKKKLDITYAFKSEKNKLDIYYPEGKGPFPCVVFFHGGAFVKGDKRKYSSLPALYALQKGYAVISVNYRLVPDVYFPDFIYDAKAAIRFIKANCKKYSIDKNKMVVWGESAGAYLACAVGITEGVDYFEDLSMGNENENTKVAAVIDWYGPINFETSDAEIINEGHKVYMYDENTILNKKVFNADGEKLVSLFRKGNLLNYVHENLPPFIIQHGTDDCLISLKQSIALNEKLAAFNNTVKFNIIEKAKHGIDDFSNKENLEYIFNYLGELLYK